MTLREIAEKLWHFETGIERKSYWNHEGRTIALMERAMRRAIEATQDHDYEGCHDRDRSDCLVDIAARIVKLLKAEVKK